MQVKSILKFARISAFKAREVAREIQGKPVDQALDLCRFTPKKAARLLEKTLKSAIANAENNNNLRASDLVILEAVVGEGPTIKRYSSRARGSGTMIRKRTSHIRIVLTDEVSAPAVEKPAGKSVKSKVGAGEDAAGKKQARKSKRTAETAAETAGAAAKE